MTLKITLVCINVCNLERVTSHVQAHSTDLWWTCRPSTPAVTLLSLTDGLTYSQSGLLLTISDFLLLVNSLNCRPLSECFLIYFLPLLPHEDILLVRAEYLLDPKSYFGLLPASDSLSPSLRLSVHVSTNHNIHLCLWLFSLATVFLDLNWVQ